jgi:predicted DCC family thiol-disulfide oxidoreductase YuxK
MKDKAIIYDDNCPMCSLYTKGFVGWGLLEKENRISFAHLHEQPFISQVDFQRAKHEIPLVDLHGGETLYGLRALTYVLSQKLPCLQRLHHYKSIYAICRILYNLVSYNRRIIVAKANPSPAPFDSTPDFHAAYRLAFILLAILSSIGITYAFGQSLNQLLSTTSGGAHLLLIAGTSWVVQFLLVFRLTNEKRIEYMGHLGVVMLIGVLALLPGMALSLLIGHSYGIIPLGSVVLSSGLMSWQHSHRVRILGLSQLWTLVWFVSLQLSALLWIYHIYFN